MASQHQIDEAEILSGIQAVEAAARGRAERRMGDAVEPMIPPDWRTVVKISNKILLKQLHVPTFVWLVNAETAVNGFDGFLKSMTAFCDAVERNWDNLVPPKDVGDLEDPYWERANIIRELTVRAQITDLVQSAPVVDVRGIGQFTVRDLSISLGQVEASPEDGKRCIAAVVQGAFTESEPQSLELKMESVRGSLDQAKRFESLLTIHLNLHDVWSDNGLLRSIELCQQNMEHFYGLCNTTGDIPEANRFLPEIENSSKSSNSITVTSLSEVASSLKCLIAYFQSEQPSNPAILLIRISLKMVGKTYFSQLQQLACGQLDGGLKSVVSRLNDDPLQYLLQSCFDNSKDEVVESEAREVSVGDGTAPANSNDFGSFSVITGVEAVETINGIVNYYSENEPSSVIPMLLRKALLYSALDFQSMLTELGRGDKGS